MPPPEAWQMTASDTSQKILQEITNEVTSKIVARLLRSVFADGHPERPIYVAPGHCFSTVPLTFICMCS